MASIQETIPQSSAVGFLSLYTHLSADGRWEGARTPPGRLNGTPICQPASLADATRALEPGRDVSIPVGDQPRSSFLPPTPLQSGPPGIPLRRVVTEAETGLWVQLGGDPGRVAAAQGHGRAGRAPEGDGAGGDPAAPES
jgi:hypothetical protein